VTVMVGVLVQHAPRIVQPAPSHHLCVVCVCVWHGAMQEVTALELLGCWAAAWLAWAWLEGGGMGVSACLTNTMANA
jgi:hypothetical protein